MTVWFGVAAALAASAVSWPLARKWGTVVVCAPIVAWAVAFGVACARGLTTAESDVYLWAVFGIVIGTATGAVGESIVRRRWPRREKAR